VNLEQVNEEKHSEYICIYVRGLCSKRMIRIHKLQHKMVLNTITLPPSTVQNQTLKKMHIHVQYEFLQNLRTGTCVPKNDRTGTCVLKMIEQEQVFQNDRAVTCVPKTIEHEQMFQNDRAVTGSKNDTNRNRCSKIKI
jgi:hypothetical protein